MRLKTEERQQKLGLTATVLLFLPLLLISGDLLAVENCGKGEVARDVEVTAQCPNGVEVTVTCLSQCCKVTNMVAGGCSNHGGLSIDVGVSALGGNATFDHIEPAIHVTPRFSLFERNDTRFALAFPVIFRPGDAPDPWDDEILFPIGPDPGSDVTSISGSDLTIGSSLIVAPAIEAVSDLTDHVSLGISAGAGFRHERGATTVLDDLGPFTTGSSTSPALTYGLSLEQQLSPRTALRWSLQGITSFHGEMGVRGPSGQRVVLDGGSHTEAMLGLAIGWRPSPTEFRPVVRNIQPAQALPYHCQFGTCRCEGPLDCDILDMSGLCTGDIVCGSPPCHCPADIIFHEAEPETKKCGFLCRLWGRRVEYIGCSDAPDGQSHGDHYIVTQYRFWSASAPEAQVVVSPGSC